MKKFVAMFVMLILLVSSVGQAYAAIPGYMKPTKPIKVFVRSKEVMLALPILTDVKAGRTLYPFRELLEYVGAEVSYDADARAAIATLDGTTVKFPLDSMTYYVNDEAKKMDTKAILDASIGRTYIPIRYAMEALGFEVGWYELDSHNQIRISQLGPYSPMSDEEYLEKYYNFDRTSIFYFKPDTVNKRMIWNDDYIEKPYKDYVLSSKNNPDINRQIYDLAKVLGNDNRYNYMHYMNDTGSRARVMVNYSYIQANALTGFDYFQYMIYENEYYNAKKDWNSDKLSDKVFATLALGKLWDDNKDVWSSPEFEKTFRDSLIAVFGLSDGKDIYQYIFTKYLKVRNAQIGKYYRTKETKTFGNIRVDFLVDESSTLQFYFSFVK